MSDTKTPLVDQLRAELLKQKAALLEKLTPAREAHDRLVNHPELIAARKAIKELSPQLAAVENELARLAPPTHRLAAEEGRYVGGK